MKEYSAIGQMYYLGRGKCDYLKPEEKCLRQAAVLSEKYKLLKERLHITEELLPVLEDYENAVADYHANECAERYAEGFKFGLLLGIEAGESKCGDNL